jgi:predicted DNA-binding transcriptional regulator AlpA
MNKNKDQRVTQASSGASYLKRRFISAKELSDYLPLTPKAIYNMISRDQIPHKHLGLKKVIFPVDEINDWLDKLPGTSLTEALSNIDCP